MSVHDDSHRVSGAQARGASFHALVICFHALVICSSWAIIAAWGRFNWAWLLDGIMTTRVKRAFNHTGIRYEASTKFRRIGPLSC